MCQFYRLVMCLPSKERYELTTLEPIVKQSNALCFLLKDNVTEELAQQSYPILSYPILSYPILSYPILSYPILSYPILSYPILSYPILSYPILSYPILSYPILSCTFSHINLVTSAYTFTIPSQSNSEFLLYMRTAIKEQTACHPVISALQKIIANIIIDRDDTPFIFLCAPSGSGKTQLAFALDTKIMYETQLYDSLVF